MRPSRPSLEATRALSPTERLAFELADFSSRYLTTPAKAWNSALMGVTLWATTGRRTDIVGLEHLSTFGPRDRVLFVCNHRSFFDFFVITATCFWRTKLSRRILFPIRSTFFYDHPLGPVVNGAMSAMSMFPPFLRDKGEDRRAFNRWAVDRCVEELAIPGTVMGLHPEGTRGTGADPYTLLPAQPGVGRIALGAVGTYVIPAFVLGFDNNIRQELTRNWRTPDQHRLDVSFGAPIDFSDLRSKGVSVTTSLRASKRCCEAIEALGARQRLLRGGATKLASAPASEL